MRKLDDEVRRAIATGWNPHAQTMKECAASVGVSERAVRKYRAQFRLGVRERVPAERAGVPLQAALDAAQDRLDGLEAAIHAVRAGLAAARAALRPNSSAPAEVESRDAAPAMTDEREEPAHPVAQVQPAPRVVPVPVPRRSYFSEFA